MKNPYNTLDLQIVTVTHYFNGGHPVGTKILIDSEFGSTVAVLGVISDEIAIDFVIPALREAWNQGFDARRKQERWETVWDAPY